MEIQDILLLEDHLKLQKKALGIIEKIEKLINYNPTSSPTRMRVLETKENMTGETPEVSKQPVAIGVHKSIFKKLQIKEVLTHINPNKTN